ncbi:MAG: hypothetical protein J3K34DRAFT_123654 [Monoraphidium minutum]|nr:MAG: hypothetical protein J3K34DRAFT_123654 [Monoraphidium minutum]
MATSAAARGAPPPDAPPGCRAGSAAPSVELDASMGSMSTAAYLDVDSCTLASGGCQSAKNFLLLDELPSPLDAGGLGRGGAGAPGGALAGGMLPLPDEPHASCMGMQPPAAHGAALAMQAQAQQHQQFQRQQQALANHYAAAGYVYGGATASWAHPHYQQQPYAHAHSPGAATGGAAGQRQLYRLVLLDDATGRPLRGATDDDAAQIARLIESKGGSSGLSAPGSLPRAMSFVGSTAAAAPAAEKRIGPCMHCGVDESPQWRKGPPHKSVLCNACGTRWRRTHQLGPAGAAAAKRKAQEISG